ncbi:protein of unknown function [Brevibacterium siliguriense]|uniref:DUF4307 domain-containing protein n=1 Tax=Brevibacterium siliguriense TaxID=1136497 RepID=A0A1H1VPY9_9MICO|nr:DUF4307 domain-containing protein [Brevibacterium siliguriense]SDS86957.1 protein of unknown function [Brevibacterium siliguriense]
MTEVTVAPPLHDDRYGRTRRPKRELSRRAKVIGVIVLAAVVAVIAVWAFSPQASPTTPRTLDYSVVDDSSTRVSVGIFPDQERDVHCIIQATNEQEAVVGFTEVTVPTDPNADPNSPKRVDVDLATTQLAASGHAESCWFE